MNRRVLLTIALGIGALTMAMVSARRAAAGAIPKPAPLIEAGAWGEALKQHPRIFGPRSFLQALATSRASEYAAIKTEAAAVKPARGKKGEMFPGQQSGIGIVATVEGGDEGGGGGVHQGGAG